MKNIEKLERLADFLKKGYWKGISDVTISKTESLYFYLSNDDFEGYVKISNHQLCEKSNGIKFMVKKSTYNIQNYEMIQDSNNIYDLTFANLDKYYYDFGNSKPSPNYWFVASGNWSYEKLFFAIKWHFNF